MQQYEAHWGSWGHWWRMLVGGAVAGGSGAAGLLLSSLALMQPLLPLWRRVLIGGVALEVFLMSLLALCIPARTMDSVCRCIISATVGSKLRRGHPETVDPRSG